jgi:hypothetical protein
MFSFSSFIQSRKRQRRFEAINRSIQKEQRHTSKDADVYDHILTGNHPRLQSR